MTGSSNCSNLKSVTGSRVVEYEVRKEISQLLLMVERYDQEKEPQHHHNKKRPLPRQYLLKRIY
jgi:hypothetical protein